MRNQDAEKRAKSAAWLMRRKFSLPENCNRIRIGLILGTGWGGALEVVNRQEINFSDIWGFESLSNLEGHDRQIVHGVIAGKEVLALRGRIHLNEGHGEDIIRMVRLQTEMLLQMGVDHLIVTSAVGSLVSRLGVGSIAVVDSFITLLAPPMPMWGGEFYSPEDMLNEKLNAVAMLACLDAGLNYGSATHVMVRGPFFEGRRKDKEILKYNGADVVGMSMLPEACVASIYDSKVIGLGFVTNNSTEKHSHEENMARAKKSQDKLGILLTNLVSRIPIDTA